MKSCKLCIFLTHPSQHAAPLFNRLSEMPEINLKVIYMFDHGMVSSWDEDFLAEIKFSNAITAKYSFVVLSPNEPYTRYTFLNVNSPKLMEEVLSFRPDYVWCFGYTSLASWKLVFHPFRKYKVCFQGDSTLLHKRAFWKRIVKKMVLKLFFNRVDILFSLGENNEKYYHYYGVSSSKIARATLPVEDEYLLKAIAGQENTNESVRKEMGFDSDIFLIGFSGKLIKRKRPTDIIYLVSQLRKSGANVGAVFMGSGSLAVELENLVQEMDLKPWIRFLGFVNQEKIGRYINAVNILCMPSSEEPFGMSVIEATFFGKPILASDSVGCVGNNDVARPGVNALIFKTGDIDDLKEKTMKVIKDKEMLRRMGQESVGLSKNFSAKNVAKVIKDTLLNE